MSTCPTLRIVLAAVFALAATPATAASIELFSNEIDCDTPAPWNFPLFIPQFDPSLGTLSLVELRLYGMLGGFAKVENRDSVPQTIRVSSKSVITARRPDGGVWLVSSPELITVTNASAFDNNLDFGGTSGSTYPKIYTSQAVYLALSDPAELALFTGLGTVASAVDGTDAATSWTDSGSTNYKTDIYIESGATMGVTYTFTPVPEASAVVQLIGLVVLAASAALTRARRYRLQN